MKARNILSAVVAGIGLLTLNIYGDTIYLTGDDAVGTSSFNAAGKWSNGQPPQPGNDYVTQGYLLRTPTNYGNYTFAGDSLLIGPPVGNPFLTNGAVNNNALINKTSRGPNGVAPIIRINNLILDGGYVRDGMGTSDAWILEGNITIRGLGGGLANQCRLDINAAIHGTAPLYLADNGSGEANRVTYINSPNNTFAGNIILLGQSTTRARLIFSEASRMNFTIGPNGVNNMIYADTSQSKYGMVAFNGLFYFDLSNAGTNPGDSWQIVNPANLFITYGNTFAVYGFTRDGGGTGPGLWYTSANDTIYYFNTETGILWVPEPGIAVLSLVGLGIVIAARAIRKSIK